MRRYYNNISGSRILFLFLIVSLFLMSTAKNTFAQNIDPQYIFVRKNGMSCNPADCSQLWNFNNPNLDFLPGINDVYNKIGTRGNSQRKLGIGVGIAYNEYNFENVKQSLRRLLDYSRLHNFPVFIALDGFQWWDKRPDLWNFWDPNQPGYNPENRQNVEWTCWDPSCAIKRAWRNWGREMEVKPHPNLASRAFIEANKERLRQLIPIISNWYHNELTADQKWLFGGITLGVEIDIGGNYYYYPDETPHNDICRSVQLGYAAVKTAGIKTSGQITSEDLNEVIRRYLNELNKLAYDLGIPRNKIFNHTGGKDISPNPSCPNLVFPTAAAALNEYGNPGWSFYGEIARNPQNFPAINNVLNQISSGEWASPEWLTWESSYKGWKKALRNSLGFRNNRLINIANWEEIRDKDFILQAIREIVEEGPSCWVTSPVIKPPIISGNQVTLSWIKGQNNQAIYLNVSTSNDFDLRGGFKTIDIANQNVTNQNSWTRTLSSGTYYYLLAADGCNSSQRRLVYGKFTVGSPDIKLLLSNYGANNSEADFNSDGKVDSLDFGKRVSARE